MRNWEKRYRQKEIIGGMKVLKLTSGLIISLINVFMAVAYALKTIASKSNADWFMDDAVRNFGEIGYRTSKMVNNYGLKGSVTFLLAILAFMLFSYIFFLAVPTIVERNKKKVELEFK